MLSWYGQPLSELPASYEIVGLIPPESVRFQVTSWRIGYKTFTPKGASAAVSKPALGLDVVRLGKASAHPQWAITAANVIAVLEPILANPATAGQVIMITPHGPKGGKHYQVEVSPVG